ncbi:MAG: hypothetical protein Q8O49_00660 [bacterium]|nr:hypothetical protein [bacterium]
MNKKNSGQAMILTVIMMSGIFMLATAIAGMVTFYQLQQASDVNNSTMAIFAADGALEEGLYRYLNTDINCDQPICDIEGIPIFSNGAIGEAQVVMPVNNGDPIRFFSFGYDPGRRTTRSLEMSMQFGL